MQPKLNSNEELVKKQQLSLKNDTPVLLPSNTINPQV